MKNLAPPDVNISHHNFRSLFRLALFVFQRFFFGLLQLVGGLTKAPEVELFNVGAFVSVLREFCSLAGARKLV